MSFNKRFITKEKVINAIKDNSVGKLINADALIMDTWSQKFFDNYDFSEDYQRDREKLNDDTKYLSDHRSTYEHENFNKLKKLSNILENLIIPTCSWIDVLLAFDMMVDLCIIHEVTPDMRGRFPLLRELCISRITSHYTTESRDKTIENILK